MASKNLGTVRAIHIGSSPPSNTAMLWYNTGINSYVQYKQYAYNIPTSTWGLLGKETVSSTLTNGTYTYIVVGDKLLHKLIHFKFIVVRNGSIATGLIEILNISSTLQISEPAGRTVYGDNSEVGIDAITFSVTYSGNNIRLVATCSNTGYNSTIDLFNIDQIL